MAATLQRKIEDHLLPSNCIIINGTIYGLKQDEKFDTIIYIDVLEHIQDDKKEIQKAMDLLAPGGHLIILSPAFNLLYSPFDKAIGHYRRYQKKNLKLLLPEYILPVRLRYLDSLGFLMSLSNRFMLHQRYPSVKQVNFWGQVHYLPFQNYRQNTGLFIWKNYFRHLAKASHKITSYRIKPQMNNDSKYSSGLLHPETFTKVTFLVSAAILSGLLLYRILLVYSYNGYIMGFDNNFVYDVVRSLNRMDLYTDPSKPPYAITLYTPLYYNICTITGKLLHINAEDPILVYQLCRYVSLACDITTCTLLYFILKKRFGISNNISFLSVTGFACILCHLGYTFSRCDSIFLTFYALFICILTKSKISNRIIFTILVALLTNACIFSKQNGIITPFIVVAWFLIKKERKLIFPYLLFFAVVFTLLLTLYFYTFNYKFFFENTVKALQNRIDISWFYANIFKRSLDSLWVLPIYSAFIIALKNCFSKNLNSGKEISIIFVIQFVFCLGTSLKWGSGAGYFNECFLLSFIIIANKTTDWARVFSHKYIQQMIYATIPLLILFAIYTICQGYLFFIQGTAQKKMVYSQQKEIRNYLQPELTTHYILDLSDPGKNFFKPLFYKEIIVPNNDMVGCCTFPDNTFDYSSLKQNISNGSVKYLILPDTNLPQKAWDAPLQNFYKDTIIYNYVIYKYKE